MELSTIRRVLDMFDNLANQAARESGAAIGEARPPYQVDVYLLGGGHDASNIIRGTNLEVRTDLKVLKLDFVQYGPGTDFGTTFIDPDGIIALRQRKRD
jgi:hypothetical protein